MTTQPLGDRHVSLFLAGPSQSRLGSWSRAMTPLNCRCGCVDPVALKIQTASFGLPAAAPRSTTRANKPPAGSLVHTLG
jgi:hypothetical protein